MAVELLVAVGNGTIFGGSTNIKGYTVVEDATPIDVSDSSGSVGTMTVQADMDTRVDGSLLLIDNTVVLNDDNLGTTTAVVSAVDDDNGDLTITAEGAMAKLTSVRRVPPYTGSLTSAITYYLGLCGITSNLVIDASFNSKHVAFPGWYGSVWDHLKQILSAEKAEIAYVSNDVIVRPLRQFTAVTYRDSDVKRTVTRGDTAQTVAIYLYESEYANHSCAYPVGAYDNRFVWTESADIQTIGGTDIITQTYDIEASIVSVDQPVCVSRVDRYDKSSSKYSVLDKDSNIVSPTAWTNGGGHINVTIGDDSTSLIVTFYGGNVPNGPFTIAYPDFTVKPTREATDDDPINNSDYPPYSSLRICASGTFYTKELRTFQTSAHIDNTPTVLGVTVDNPYINTEDQLQDCAAEVIATYSAAKQTLNVTTTGINRLGVSGNYHYPTFQEFDDDNPGELFADFDIRFADFTFDQFDDYYITLVRTDFHNQAFGNVAGARVLKGEAQYRIDTCTHTEENDTYTATEDTLIDDFDNVWDARLEGATFADFDAWWDDKSFNEFDRIPLWIMPLPALTGGGLGTTYPSSTTYPNNGTYPGFSLNGDSGGGGSTGYPGTGYPGSGNLPGE